MLCFGLSTAPQVFTRVFATVSAWAHSRGVRLLRYLDGWYVLASSETRAKQHVRDLLSLCHSLGIVINEEKSDLNPSQSVEYLGMSIDTVVARAFPTVARVERFLSIARRFLSCQNPPPPPPALAGIVGTHVIAGEAGSPWETQDAIDTMASEVPLVPERDPPHLPVPRSRQVEEDLSWWMVKDHLLKGMNLGTPTPDLRLYSDASRSGWGAHLRDRSVSGIWSEQESSLHINLVEMKALFLAIKSFVNIVTNH